MRTVKVKVKVTKEFYDQPSRNYPVPGDVLDVEPGRAKTLIEAGVAEEQKEIKSIKKSEIKASK